MNSSLQVLALEAVLGGCVTVAAQAFMALDRPGIVTLLQLAGLLTAFPMLLLLVPRYGVLGAAGAVFASTLVRLVLTLFSFRPVLGEPPPKLLPTRQDIEWLVQRVSSLRGNRIQVT